MQGHFKALCCHLVVANIVVLPIQEHSFSNSAARSHTIVTLFQANHLLLGIEGYLWHNFATMAKISANWFNTNQDIQFIPIPDLILLSIKWLHNTKFIHKRVQFLIFDCKNKVRALLGGIGGDRAVVKNIHGLQPLYFTEDLLLIWQRKIPPDVLRVQGNYLCCVSNWDSLKH